MGQPQTHLAVHIASFLGIFSSQNGLLLAVFSSRHRLLLAVLWAWPTTHALLRSPNLELWHVHQFNSAMCTKLPQPMWQCCSLYMHWPSNPFQGRSIMVFHSLVDPSLPDHPAPLGFRPPELAKSLANARLRSCTKIAKSLESPAGSPAPPLIGLQPLPPCGL